MAGREAGSPGELIAGHTDQVKSQWAASEVAAVISFQSTFPPQQRPDLALVSQPCAWCVFCQHFSGTRKDQACKNQGSVLNIITTALKTVTVTQNEREKRRTSLGKSDWPYTSFYHHRSLQKLTHFTLGAQPAVTWVLTKGCATPGTGSGDCVGLTPSTSGSCTWKHHICSLPEVCFVPSEIPNVWIEGVDLINLWSFFFSSPCRIHMRSGTFEWLAALCSAEWKPLEVSY